MHERFPKHSSMGTARPETRIVVVRQVPDEEGKKRDAIMERSKAATKEKRSPEGLNYPNQNTTIINVVNIIL